jgi:very-short-patch-repair endonuclease
MRICKWVKTAERFSSAVKNKVSEKQKTLWKSNKNRNLKKYDFKKWLIIINIIIRWSK